jgi:hypothetical protein
MKEWKIRWTINAERVTGIKTAHTLAENLAKKS